jgi:hypothetical protein
MSRSYRVLSRLELAARLMYTTKEALTMAQTLDALPTSVRAEKRAVAPAATAQYPRGPVAQGLAPRHRIPPS